MLLFYHVHPYIWLVSGNNLLIKTQIDELRRILFSKLDVVNKMCILKKQKLKIQKQYLRKTPVQKVKVFTPTPSKRPIGRKMTEFKKRQEEMVIIQKKEEINTMEKEINKTIRDINEEKSKIQKHIEKLKDECRLPKTCQVKLENLKDTYSNSSLKAILTLANGDVPNNKHARKSLCVEDYIQRLFKDDGPEADPENNDNYETESQDDSSQKSGLEDFDSFTEVISKKLNIKPEEASPSLILSKFRNNLNKKLQQSRSSSFVDESEVIELGLDDFKEEEHLVEEIFYEGIDYDETFEERVMKTFSGDWSENNAINNGIKQEDSNLVHENENSSYIIQDLNEYRPPSHSKEYYNINDVTIMKLPVASHQPSSSPPTENTQQIENTFNSEEQSSLRDREEGMSNLRHMENSHSTDQSIRSTLLNNQNKPTETKAFIRRIIQSSLETKLADLEAKAELARLSLQHLNEKKFKANRELKLLGLEADAKLARQSLQQLKEGKYTVNHEHENIEHNITSEDNTLKLPYVFENDNKCLKKTFSNENSLDHKLKSLFKNNNLRNLLKRKLTSNESDKNDLGSEEEKRKRDSLSSHQMSDLEGNEMQEDRGTATENVNIDEQIATSSSTNHKAKMVLDKPKLCETKNMAKNVENKRTKNNERKTKIVVQEVHDFGLRRNIIKIDKKKSKKPRALTLPGESSKLLLLKSHAHRIESKTKVIKVKAKRKQPNKEKFEEFDSSDKSKQLLENLKQQIFNKLHRQENTKRATEVKQEIERRLRRKEKLKAKRKK